MIYNCIDLMKGKAVQLVQGKRKALEVKDIDSLIEKFKPFGAINVIDLDAALGKGNNINLIKKITKKIKCRVGGGIRTVTMAKYMIRAGAAKVIVGSSAFKDDKINNQFLESLKKTIGKNKIIIAVDSKKGKIVVKGWKKSTGLDALKVVKKLEPYCSEFLYTYVDKEGTMKGTNIKFIKKLKKSTKNKLTAAGGISSLKEIKELKKAKIDCALGMAVYTGKLKIEELKKI
ncbi:1-(5-phosphoribosyl)-5-[(5-phosphoribosylamino)methylideneamino] imidazole-4-carboxamide isomerase [Candidatus Woesearchaeota archaeon]|nr:1-(5-phosphoribosyl)-5-[(5-phosphoribosylamino)methylideneamino] imidazole-4-carboxamide isomerase [Candidatus Woesearchaeota archaeon]